ncbi:hypothetical protein HU200_003221 [Digitaria exilis]|uniref:BHLH domain-containing protein n=1 Tax=Digitaria exilis TaxID=1010633 RepID=A0A835FV68_9POAL|nr:hypothetical protein HU200_003221 [Digitaria exilis]
MAAEGPPLDAVAAPSPAVRRTEQALSFLHEVIPAAAREGERAPLMATQGLPPPRPPPPADCAVERRRLLDRAVQRRRRRRVAALYAELRSMLPSLPTTTRRVTMEEILVAAAARVKALEDTAATLEAYRAAQPRRTGRDVAVCPATVTPAGGALLRRVLEAFERRGARVLVATMARHGGGVGAGDVVDVTVTANAAAPEDFLRSPSSLQLPFVATHHQPKAASLCPNTLVTWPLLTPYTPPMSRQGHHHHYKAAAAASPPPPQDKIKVSNATLSSRAAMTGGGGWTLDLSLATAGTSAAASERRVGWRRRTVSSLFAELGSMLPNLPTDRVSHSTAVLDFSPPPPHGATTARQVSSFLSFSPLSHCPLLVSDDPATQEEIVEAATAQVKMLEEEAAILETYRAVRRGPRPGPRPEVAVAVATVCFCVRLPARPGALTRVLGVFHRRGVEVLVATVARHGGAAVVTVTAAAAPPEVLEMISADIGAIY